MPHTEEFKKKRSAQMKEYWAKLKKSIKPETSDFHERLKRFSDFMKVLEGKEDARQKFNFLLNPDNKKTSSYLQGRQVEFIADANWFLKAYPEFAPLKDLADEVSDSMISFEGKGVESVIRYEQASRQPGMPTQFGIFQTPMERKEGKEREEKSKESKT